MATTPILLNGSSRPRDVVAALSIFALAMLQLWELPRMVADHGGFAFFAAWVLCLMLLALPVLMLEMMLGRRSRHSPMAGMAVLTREADASRIWRASVWVSALTGTATVAALALLAGGSINFLAREVGLVGAAGQAVMESGLMLPLGTGVVLLVAAGFSLMTQVQRSLLSSMAILLVVLLLVMAALAGQTAAASVYHSSGLLAADWREALRMALLSMGSGLGVLWLAGLQTPKAYSLAKLGLLLLLTHIVLALLLLLALAPFVAAAQVNPVGEILHIVPTGATVWILMMALVVTGVVALMQVAEPLLQWLQERGLLRLPAVVLVFGVGAVTAEVLWFVGRAGAVQGLLKILAVLLLMVILGFSVFAGWMMKVSHARRELALPNEGIYNLWRVAVRIALPLAIVWVLSGYIL